MLPKLTFILGGANSGKTGYAEELAQKSGLSLHYVATAQVLDAEMSAKVANHKASRVGTWITHESPFDLAPALSDLIHSDVALVDCATMWLSNHMLGDSDLDSACRALVQALETCAAPVIVVSNEVGNGIVPDNALARRFRTEQGRLNILLARQADLAIQVVAGLPQVLKGTLP